MSADVSARLAWPSDAATISALQQEHWRARYGEALDAQGQINADEMAERWDRLITAPRDARIRTLVALERASIRGFALVHPCHDPDADQIADGEIGEFVVAEEFLKQGHGSRLLQACADTLRADGFRRAVWWLTTNADEVRGFAESAGWEADGAHRELEGPSGRLKQVRLHTALL